MSGVGAKILLVVHAASAVVLIGSVTHHGLMALQRLRGRPVRDRLQRVYRRVVTWSYTSTFLLGAILYPTFRVDVRAGYLDAHAPLLVGLFEIKEHWLALGLLMVWGLAALEDRSPTVPAEPRPRAWLASGLALALTTVVWLAFFTGLSVAAVRPV